MGTVKYSGPVASFHCPTEATIRSLKVHFSPKQLGSGTPSPENVREIVGWDGVVVHNDDGNIVPEEYQKVEYIESNGTQYLNTQINGVSGLNIECILMLNSNANISNCGMIGSRENNSNTRFYAISFLSSKWHVGLPKDSLYREVLKQVKYKARLETSSTKYALYINDELYGSANSYQATTYPLYIFACNNYGTASRFCSGRIYSVLIDNETTKLFNGIPCRRKSDNKPGMYDTVSDEFFTNQGTGEFICGPDVGETVEYEFGVLGKNKLSDNIEDYTLVNAPTDIIFSNGSFSGTVNAGQRDVAICKLNNKYPAGTYTLSFDYVNNIDNTNWRPALISKYNDSSWYSALISTNPATESSGHYVKTFTATEDFYIHLTLNCFGSASTTAVNSISNLQLELGSTATTYEPYDPNKTVYGGWVDLVSGEVTSTYIHCKIKDLPGEWNYRSGNNRFQITLTNNYANATSSGGIWTHFATSEIYATSTSNGYGNKQIATYINKHIYIRDDDFEGDVEAFLNDVGDTYVTYELAESTTYFLSPTEMQTFLGQNNVWSNADYVEVEYDLHETQTILARKQFIMANQPHIVKPVAASLQNFVTDMVAPLKECKVYFEPVQDTSNGAPSPDNICPISGWENLEIYRAGKNLIPNDVEWWPQKIKPTNNVITGSVYYSFYFPVPRGLIQYHCDSTTRPAYGCFIDEPPELGVETFNNMTISSRSNYTYDNSDGHKYMLICGPTTATYNTVNEYVEERGITIESVESSTVLTFSTASQSDSILITFPSEAGTVYGGTLDAVNGVLTVNRAIASVGKSGFSDKIVGRVMDYRNSIDRFPPTASYVTWGWARLQQIGNICKIANANTESVYGDYVGVVFTLPNTPGYAMLRISEPLYQAMSENDVVEICYQLATPITYTITPTQLKTLRGTNNIWASNGGDNIEIAYWKH